MAAVAIRSRPPRSAAMAYPRLVGRSEEARFLLVGPEVTSNAAGGKPDWSYTSAP
jgi:hypothetical protein